jgi:hypothetical protein
MVMHGFGSGRLRLAKGCLYEVDADFGFSLNDLCKRWSPVLLIRLPSIIHKNPDNDIRS